MPARTIVWLVLATLVAGACSRPGSTEQTETRIVSAEVTLDDSADNRTGDDQLDNDDKTLPLPPERPDTLAGYEDLWAMHRSDTIDRIVANGWGVDANNVLRGPTGLSVDLNDCPPGWSDTPFRPDGGARTSYLWPQSGNLAAYYPPPALAMSAYFETVGPIGGHPITVETVDTEYNPVAAGEAASRALATDPPPLAVISSGLVVNPAVVAALDGQCVPHVTLGPLQAVFVDPAGRPWNATIDLAFTTEMAVAVQHLADSDRRRVAVLAMDNVAGDLMLDSLTAAADGQGLDILAVERHDPASKGLDAEMARLAETDPDAVILLTAGIGCLDGLTGWVNAVPDIDRDDTAVIVAQFCQDPAAFLEPAGAVADGVLGVRGPSLLDDPGFRSSDPFARFSLDTLAEAGIDTAFSASVEVFAYEGWLHTQLLQIAAELPGGLRRSNYLLALWASRLQPPSMADGLWWSTDGPADPFPVEAATIASFDLSGMRWEQLGPLVNLEGETPRLRGGLDRPAPSEAGAPPPLTDRAAAIPLCAEVEWTIPIDGARSNDPDLAIEQEYRAQVGLKSDETWIRHVHTLDMPPGRIEKDGWFTDEEMDYLENRPQIDPILAFDQIGAWGDANGNRVVDVWLYGRNIIVVGIADPTASDRAAIASIIDPAWRLEFHELPHDRRRLHEVAAVLVDRLRTLQRSGKVTFYGSAEVDHFAGLVAVGVGTIDDTDRALLAELVDPETVCLR